MRTRWIVENFTKEPSYLELVEAIKKESGDVREISNDFKYTYLDEYNDQDPVIFFGSIEMTKIALAHLKGSWPVAYCTNENYLCSKYLSHYGPYLFNDQYAMVSLKELQRRKFFFYGLFGREALMFIRPDSGQKTFQAGLVDLLDFDRFCEKNKPYEHDLVVVSTPKTIRGEWRFVVSKYNEIISYSTYRYQGQLTLIPSAPQGAINLVKEMLTNVSYKPDSVFVMDICEDSDGKYWLLELNSFSSAGLYACDKTAIVKRVSEIAEADWKVWHQESFDV